jgi:hypothetical protein
MSVSTVRNRRLIRSACVVLAMTMVPSWATARTKSRDQRRETQEKMAKKACITGDFRKGVDILGDLYVETNDLTYVYNQGRCFEQNHMWQEALDRFREFERKSPAGASDGAEELGRHIAECQSHLDAEKAAKVVPIAPVETPPTAVPAATPQLHDSTPAPLPASTSLPADSLVAPAVSNDGHGTLRTAGFVVGAVGVAALATGVVFNLKSNSLTNDMYPPGRYDADKDSTRKSYETLSWVGYGLGAAGIVAGTTMVVLGWNTKATSTALLVPQPIPGGAAVTLKGVY